LRCSPPRCSRCAVAPAHAQIALGDAIPMADVKMKNVNDKSVTLASLAGKKGTLVVFTCNHCPWAKMWQSRVAEIGNAALAAGLGRSPSTRTTRRPTPRTTSPR
jgi:hypothetical protein